VAGDRAELETIISSLETENAANKSCAIGSVKTLIGHTKCTAGVAGLIKVALSLHHKVLPPHLGVDTPLDPIADPESPVYLLKEAQPWLTNPNYPRRGSLSAFGFGGTNFHAVLEEYQGKVQDIALGAQTWPCELFVLRAKDCEDLAKEVRFLSEALHAGAEPTLRDLAYTYAKVAPSRCDMSVCLSLVVESRQQLKEALDLVLNHLNSHQPTPLPPHIQLNLSVVSGQWSVAKTTNKGQRTTDKIAFLFPGQGAQYPDMAREVALYFKEMREALEFGQSSLLARFPKPLSQFIYPPSAYSEAAEEYNKQLLTDTHIAQPAIGAVEAGYLDLIRRLGLEADMVGGHSYGEYTALHAAGVLSRETFLKLSETRGRVMSTACAAADGAMAAVQTTREELLARLKGFGGVVIANHNAPLQSVISGEKKAVRQVVDSLNSLEVMARMLPVAGAFHSSLVASAQATLAGAIASAPIQPPKIPVYGNSTARPYNSEIDAIRNQLSKHLLSPVEFVAQINAMYEDGARIFVEVGPKSILSKLVSQILAGKNHTVVSLDGQGGGLRGLLIALGTLVTRGVSLNLTTLFEGRDVQQLDLSRLVELTRKPELPPTAWLVNGGSARPMSEAIGYTGKLPPLSLETATQASKQREHRHEEIKKTFPPTNNPPAPGTQRPTSSLANHELPSTIPLQMSTPISKNGASQPGIPQASSPNHQVPVSGEAALIAYQAYQQTMRQFLTLQEQVMQQFLSGSQMNQTIPQTPAATPAPRIPASQPSGSINRYNGNGVVTGRTPPQMPTPKAVQPPQPVIHEVPPVAVSPTVEPPKPIIHPEVPQVAVSPTVEPPIPPSPPTPTRSSLLDRAGLIQTLLQLVSDRTGYPAEMLGLDQDLEAELGIDSIKRVEILGALQKSLPEPLAASVKEWMESLTRVKSLNGIVDLLLVNQPTADKGNDEREMMNDKQDNHSLFPQTAAAYSSGTASLTVPDKSTLTQTLLRLVSDRTGYPTEMLGLDQDLEAELGIDSIKRVEILGALQKSLPEPLAASVKERMESLTRVKSLNGMVEQLLLNLPNSTSTVAAPSQTPPVTGGQGLAPLMDRATLTQTLLHLVSDRTGYPAEMLGLDQDLEAELGIDSIKRVEILGALQKSLPESLVASVQSKMESLTRVKSLNGLVDQLLGMALPVAGVQEENGLGKLTAQRSPFRAT
jgi:malonyl CoA-acyl carrier protein transacylase